MRYISTVFGFLFIVIQMSSAQSVNDRIVFMSDRDGNREIYTMNPDGSDVRRLTNNNFQDLQPSWSPDKTRIAFVSNRDGNFAIYVMNIDGTGQRRISTDEFAYHEYPAWSPDGRYIAYASDRAGSFDIYIMEANGNNPQRLTSGDTYETEPAWSPDGRQIAYLQQVDGAFEVFLVNTNGGTPQRLTQSGGGDYYSARWSPDGSRLAYALTVFDRAGNNSDIYVRNIATGEENLLISRENSFIQGLSWSENGSTLVYQVQEIQAKWIIHRVSTSDASLQILTDQSYNSETPSWSTPQMTGVVSVTSSPSGNLRMDGRVTANVLNVRTGPGPEYGEITQIRNGANVSAIGRNVEATWVQVEGSAQGWINARYVQFSSSGVNLSDLPITFTEVGEWSPAGTPTGLRVTATTVLRIRGGPGSNYRQLENPDTVKTGETVDVIGRSRNGEWYKVNVGNRSGWIVSGYVRLSGNTNANIPVVSD
jgi:Tol biopolymer transport system component